MYIHVFVCVQLPSLYVCVQVPEIINCLWLRMRLRVCEYVCSMYVCVWIYIMHMYLIVCMCVLARAHSLPRMWEVKPFTSFYGHPPRTYYIKSSYCGKNKLQVCVLTDCWSLWTILNIFTWKFGLVII